MVDGAMWASEEERLQGHACEPYLSDGWTSFVFQN